MTDRPAQAQRSRDDQPRSERDATSGSSDKADASTEAAKPAKTDADGPATARRSGPSENTQKTAAPRKSTAKPASSGEPVSPGRREASEASTSTRGGRVQAALAGPGTASAPGQPAAERGSTRTARLRLTRLDPWSVMKTSFLLSIAFGIVTVVAVAIVWGVLGAAGVWEAVNTSVQQIVGGDAAGSFDVEDYLGADRVLGFTMLVAVVDVVLITAIATLTAFLYNLAAALLGGLEVTLAEDDR